MQSPDVPTLAANDEPYTDRQRRFLFDHADIRGEVVCLEQAYQDVIRNYVLPTPLKNLLGECLAAVSLLASTLKFEGTITLQARGDGDLSMIMAEATDDGKLRGIARPADSAPADAFEQGHLQSWLGTQAVLAIIIEPKVGQRYQGLVPLDAPSLSECLQHYFEQSEQLHTRFWLFSDDTRCGGLLLQALPASGTRSASEAEEQWTTLSHLASTVKPDEILHLSQETLLYRLYHEWPVRLFEPKILAFQCTCSRERCLNALQTTGEQAVKDILAEQGAIEMDCQFCSKHYRFEWGDLDHLFSPAQPTQH